LKEKEEKENDNEKRQTGRKEGNNIVNLKKTRIRIPGLD
jgi:hypothetical protein